MHPDYNSENGMLRNDICLVRVPSLVENAPENCVDCFRHVCLPPKINDLSQFTGALAGQHCWIGGWGSASKQSKKAFLSNKLRDTGINIFRLPPRLGSFRTHFLSKRICHIIIKINGIHLAINIASKIHDTKRMKLTQ